MDEPGQRYDPVGSSNECDANVEEGKHEHLQCSMEKEQEKLSTSLQALTSHFAQVQFRLRQIISAPEEEKLNLIENLDEFASRGIYDDTDDCMLSVAVNQQQANQFKLIEKLQTELSAASNFANEKEINLEMKNSESIIANEEAIDSSDTNLNHLKTQIFCLDSFVTDLRYVTINLKQMTRAMEGYRACDNMYGVNNVNVQGTRSTCQSLCDEGDNIFAEYDVHENKKPLSTLQRYEQSLNEVRQAPLTDAKSPTTKPIKYSSPNVSHWGHIRAKLEIDVQNIISAVSIQPFNQFEHPNSIALILQKEITKMVRKELCGTLRELIEHGLHSKGYELNFLSCCIRRADKRKPSSNEGKWKSKHAWDIIMEFYNLNDGSQRYRKPCNTLTQSFQLNHSIIASVNDQLLQAIGDIINIHVRSNASENSYFKAFVLFGLNLKKLPQWLSTIFKCPDLIEANYSDESLVRQPEFVAILECLAVLSNYELNLPINTLTDRFNKIDKNIFD